MSGDGFSWSVGANVFMGIVSEDCCWLSTFIDSPQISDINVSDISSMVDKPLSGLFDNCSKVLFLLFLSICKTFQFYRYQKTLSFFNKNRD